MTALSVSDVHLLEESLGPEDGLSLMPRSCTPISKNLQKSVVWLRAPEMEQAFAWGPT